MEGLAKRCKRQSVVYDVIDGRRCPTVVEPVDMPPDAIGTAQLLVHESDGRLPVCDTRLPAQRNPEQAEPVVDQGPLLYRDRLRREDSESEFPRGDALQVSRVGEKGKHLLAWQRHTHGCHENVERHASYCS